MASADAATVCPQCGGLLVPSEAPAEGQRPTGTWVCSKCGAEKQGPRKKILAKLVEWLIGPVGTIVGAIVTYVYSVGAYDDALRRAPEVSLSLKGLILGPLALVAGPIFTVFTILPSGFVDRLKGTKKGAYLGLFMLALCALAAIGGLVTYFWVRSFVKSQGYDV